LFPNTYITGEFQDEKYFLDISNIIRDCHKKIHKFKDLTIIGHGITSGPEYPVKEISKNKTKLEIKKSKGNYNKNYLKPLDKLFKKAKTTKQPIIFLTHNVPYNTRLDKILDKKSPRYGQHFGSYLARDLIIKHNPLISIGGHMHEHFKKDKLKETTIITNVFSSLK
jgi:Icc-related predicted phosphoesterase